MFHICLLRSSNCLQHTGRFVQRLLCREHNVRSGQRVWWMLGAPLQVYFHEYKWQKHEIIFFASLTYYFKASLANVFLEYKSPWNNNRTLSNVKGCKNQGNLDSREIQIAKCCCWFQATQLTFTWNNALKLHLNSISWKQFNSLCWDQLQSHVTTKTNCLNVMSNKAKLFVPIVCRKATNLCRLVIIL